MNVFKADALSRLNISPNVLRPYNLPLVLRANPIPALAPKIGVDGGRGGLEGGVVCTARRCLKNYVCCMT